MTEIFGRRFAINSDPFSKLKMERIYTKRLDQIRDKQKKDALNAQRKTDSAKQVYLLSGVLSGHAPTDLPTRDPLKMIALPSEPRPAASLSSFLTRESRAKQSSLTNLSQFDTRTNPFKTT